jgi:hypothetical protein
MQERAITRAVALVAVLGVTPAGGLIRDYLKGLFIGAALEDEPRSIFNAYKIPRSNNNL